MKRVVAFLSLSVAKLMGQKPEFLEGLGQGYDGEWAHASRQLVALAEAIPPLRKVIFPSRATGKSAIYLVSQRVILNAFIPGKPTRS